MKTARETMQNQKVDLERCALLEGLSEEAIAEIRKLATERAYGAEHTVFSEGEPAQELFILASGRVALDYTLPSNPEVKIPITRVEPGDVFGWSAIVHGRFMTARARVLEDAVVHVIPAEDFNHVLETHPDAGYLVMKRLTELVASRLRDTRSQLRWLQSSS